jgi:LuxR family maltose regulon positive regulatory protein
LAYLGVGSGRSVRSACGTLHHPLRHGRTGIDEAEALIRASLLNTVDASLCGALVGIASARELLARIERDSGLVKAIEAAAKLSTASLIEYLRDRARELPRSTIESVHRTAAEWYAANGRIDEAAEHAFRGGMKASALAWIEARLRLLASQGRMAEVLAWLDRLPEQELASHEGIQLTLAWACTLCRARRCPSRSISSRRGRR